MFKLFKLYSVMMCFLLLSGGCKKETCQEPEFNAQSLRAAAKPFNFKMDTKAWYRISPTTPATVPGIPGQLSFENIAGAGAGHSSHIGNVSLWFNQLAYSPDGQNPPSGSIAAPVTATVNYPALGAPLPYIQPNDFAGFATIITWLQIPETMNGYIINNVIYNQHADALFLSATTTSTSVESATRINFTGDGIIVGGRGKYENATGTYHFTGFFNPQDAFDARFSVDGTVSTN